MKQCKMLSRMRRDLYRVRYALILFFVYAIPAQLIFHTICPFAILTGFPCPGCGLTRAGLCLLKGQFFAAWEIHPLIYLWAILLLCLIIFRYVLDKNSFPVFPTAVITSLATLIYYFYRCASGIFISLPCKGILRIAFQGIL